MRKKTSFHGEEGFTLAELMVALLIFSLLMVGTFEMVSTNIKASEVYAIRANLSQELREASNAMVDQIRTANSFSVANNTDMVFQSYITGDNNLYNAEFFLQNGDLIYRSKLVSGGSLGAGDDRILASGVTALNFDYYDVAGTTPLTIPINNLNSITRVEIKLTLTRGFQGTTESDSVTTTVRIKV
jgi:prepilin-type N-terminal cleavage/methylation domain-containing protein